MLKKIKSFFTRGDNPIERYEMDEEKKEETKAREIDQGTMFGGSSNPVDKKRRQKDEINDEEEIDQYVEDTGRRISR